MLAAANRNKTWGNLSAQNWVSAASFDVRGPITSTCSPLAISHETRYVHNSHKTRNAQAQFIEQFLPNGGIVAAVEEANDAERAPAQVQ